MQSVLFVQVFILIESNVNGFYYSKAFNVGIDYFIPIGFKA